MNRSIQIGTFNQDLPIAPPKATPTKKAYKVHKADKHLFEAMAAPGEQTDLLRQAGTPAYARAIVSDQGKVILQYHDARGRFFSGGKKMVTLCPGIYSQSVLTDACIQHDFALYGHGYNVLVAIYVVRVRFPLLGRGQQCGYPTRR